MKYTGIFMVSKRFAALIMSFNMIMSFLILLPNLLILSNIAYSGSGYPMVVRNFNIFSILTETYYPPGVPAPQIAFSPTIYLPTYAFIFALIVNAFFVTILLRRKE